MAGGTNSTLADDKTVVRQPRQTKLQGFCEFLYNRKEGKVLGRTGKSWCEITAFYIVFYSCLAGFFAANLTIFLKTLDDKWPRYYGKGSIIGINPGLGYQPWLKENAESTLIQFHQNDSKSYEKYTAALKTFWDRYENVTKEGDGFRRCHNASSNREQDATDACIFDLAQFRAAGCGPPHFGFDLGRPCIALTLNKLIGWEPVRYPYGSVPDNLPTNVRDSYNGDIAISCEGEYYADQENIGLIRYIPQSGINRTFFPYRVMKNYHQPFAMVKFESLKPGILVEVECKAYAYNIIHDRANRLGMVHFEMFLLNVKNDTEKHEPSNEKQFEQEASADGS